MKRLTALLVLFLYICTVAGHHNCRLDSLLTVLDDCVQKKDLYTQNKLQYIDELTRQCRQTTSDEHLYMIYGQLFEEYICFQMDSAHAVIDKRIQIARKLNNKNHIAVATLNSAEVMIVTGMYKEALDILNEQNRSKHENEVTAYIYHLYHSLYMLMAEYSFSSPEREYYLNMELNYKDSILSVIDPGSVAYGLVKSSRLIFDRKYDEALTIAQQTYVDNPNNNRILAMIAHTLADIYTARQDSCNIQRYLALSAIYDMRSGVKEYMSLSELAVRLFNGGDIDRAYSYMKCSLEDAIYCKARLRALELSRMLPIINETYDIKMKQEKDRLKLFLLLIVLLTVVLAIALFFIYKKMRELATARQLLKTANDHLSEINTDLKKLNAELSESNLVKEEYISYVFTMCSTYIDKLDDFRKKTSRKIKAGQVDDLYNEVKSNTFVTDELKEFYKSFDSIFLNIYPEFIADFNSLLHKEERIYPKEGELLSPELRIYALVRLGIGDSVKIASFLHYSPQTVYNYRLKVRNKAKIPKEEFPQAVKQLGRIGR